MLVYCLVALAGVGFCLYYAEDIIARNYKCDPEGRLSTLLTAVLAAAGGLVGSLLIKR